MKDNWFDEASDKFRLRILFPKFFEEKMIQLCKESEESRKKLSDMQKVSLKDQSWGEDGLISPDGVIIDKLSQFYRHGGYWAIMMDAKKKSIKGKERGAMVFETHLGQVNCIKEELLIGFKESNGRRKEVLDNYDYKYDQQSICQMIHAYRILAEMDPERFNMIDNFNEILDNYHITLRKITKEGISKIKHEIYSDVDSRFRIVVDTFKNSFDDISHYSPDQESSKYVESQEDNEFEEPIVLKGSIKSSRHKSDIYFKVLRINDEYKVQIYNLELSSYINQHYIQRICDDYQNELTPELDKLVIEFKKTEEENLRIWEIINKDIIYRNNLEMQLAAGLEKLKSENKNIIENYLAAKNIDKMV